MSQAMVVYSLANVQLRNCEGVLNQSYVTLGGMKRRESKLIRVHLGKSRRKTSLRIVAAAMDDDNSISLPRPSGKPLSDSTIWGDSFLSYPSQLTQVTSKEKFQHEESKEMVRKMLEETGENSTQKLVLIDTIQRLGVAHHFSNEIETSLQNIFDAYQQSENVDDDNLYTISLRFRLVRQQGHYMSSDVFKQFTNHDGKFKETLANDVQALLSLYEASHMRVRGEDILEEALTFTTTHLESTVDHSNLSYSLKVQVTEALSDQPLRKTLPRIVARRYIDIYENTEGHNDILLKFAKLDFNMFQKLQKEELHDLTRWAKDLDLGNKFPYTRDIMVDGYFWSMAVCFEPQYRHERKLLAKLIKLSTIIDDTYDGYATYDELVLFTDAIDRMDMDAMDSLPPYMRSIYKPFMDTFNEMEEELTKEDKLDRIYYAKEEMKKFVKSYFKEAEWINAGYIPKSDEFLKNGLLTSYVVCFVITSLAMMEKFKIQEIEWLIKEPLVIQASSAICRLMDDMTDHEVDEQRGNVASYVECYIKEYGVSKEVAYTEIKKQIANAWKDINKAFLLRPKEVPISLLEPSLNLARANHTFFKDGRDGYTSPEKSKVKDLFTLLFVESIN